MCKLKFKYAFIVLVIIAVAYSCSSTKTAKQSTSQETTKAQINSTDSTEFELLIFDNDFQTWFTINKKPITYYSESYYKQQNTILSQEYNSIVISNEYRPPFTDIIDYDPSESYGVKLDYELYYYFKYLESKYGDFSSFP